MYKANRFLTFARTHHYDPGNILISSTPHPNILAKEKRGERQRERRGERERGERGERERRERGERERGEREGRERESGRGRGDFDLLSSFLVHILFVYLHYFLLDECPIIVPLLSLIHHQSIVHSERRD
jgi:hypothetical protein